MKTMTLEQFKELSQLDGWKIECEYGISEKMDREEYEQVITEDYCEVIVTEIPHILGWATVTSTLGNIQIIYEETYSHDYCMPDTLETDFNSLTITGVTVVDEDGDEICDSDILAELSSEFDTCNYSHVTPELDDIDFDEDSNMETFTLDVDNKPNIRFNGELIAYASSSDNNASGSSYSGSTGRWTELALYKTAGGKFICHQIGRTRWEGERDRYSAEVCDDEAGVVAYFGHGWLSKELYENANISDAVTVD